MKIRFDISESRDFESENQVGFKVILHKDMKT